MTEEELWNWIMDGNYPEGWPKTPSEKRLATAVLSKDIVVEGKTWKAGKKVKVVMASRFGDVGITDRLDATSGYSIRTQCVEAESFGDSTKIPPAGLLVEITPC